MEAQLQRRSAERQCLFEKFDVLGQSFGQAQPENVQVQGEVSQASKLTKQLDACISRHTSVNDKVSAEDGQGRHGLGNVNAGWMEADSIFASPPSPTINLHSISLSVPSQELDLRRARRAAAEQGSGATRQDTSAAEPVKPAAAAKPVKSAAALLREDLLGYSGRAAHSPSRKADTKDKLWSELQAANLVSDLLGQCGCSGACAEVVTELLHDHAARRGREMALLRDSQHALKEQVRRLQRRNVQLATSARAAGWAALELMQYLQKESISDWWPPLHDSQQQQPYGTAAIADARGLRGGEGDSGARGAATGAADDPEKSLKALLPECPSTPTVSGPAGLDGTDDTMSRTKQMPLPLEPPPHVDSSLISRRSNEASKHAVSAASRSGLSLTTVTASSRERELEARVRQQQAQISLYQDEVKEAHVELDLLRSALHDASASVPATRQNGASSTSPVRDLLSPFPLRQQQMSAKQSPSPGSAMSADSPESIYLRLSGRKRRDGAKDSEAKSSSFSVRGEEGLVNQSQEGFTRTLPGKEEERECGDPIGSPAANTSSIDNELESLLTPTKQLESRETTPLDEQAVQDRGAQAKGDEEAVPADQPAAVVQSAGDEEGGEKHDLTPGARHADDERQEMWLRRGSIERGDASPLAAMVSCQYPPEASLNEGSINEGEGSLRWPGACLERGHMDKTPIKSCAQEFSAEGARMQEAIEADGPSAAEGCQIMVHDGDTESDSESDTDEIGLKWDAEIRKGSEVQTASITIGTVVGDVSAGMWLHDAASDTGGARFVSFADLDSKMSHARDGSQATGLTAAEEGLESPHMREPAVLLRLESPRTGPTNPALDPYPSDAQAPAQAEDGIAVKSWLREEMDVDLLEQVETQASGSNDAGEKGNRWSGAGQQMRQESEPSDRSALLTMRTASELSCTAAVATWLQDAETTSGAVKRQEGDLRRAPLLIRSPGLRRKARLLSQPNG